MICKYYDCKSLTNIVIPESVTEIGELAFHGCTGLTKIVVSEGNKVYDSRGNCNAIIETETNALISGCESTVIPDTVTEIRAKAFHGCTGLTSIVIGNSMTEIGSSAFEDCTGLTSIFIPDSVTEISETAFRRCTGLTKIVVSEGNTVYDSRNNCNAIIETATNNLIYGRKSTVIPNSVKMIGWYAFLGCTGLKSIVIPDSVNCIGKGAFYGCTGLTNIVIPDSVKEIETYDRSGCWGPDEVVRIPASWTDFFRNEIFGD